MLEVAILIVFTWRLKKAAEAVKTAYKITSQLRQGINIEALLKILVAISRLGARLEIFLDT